MSPAPHDPGRLDRTAIVTLIVLCSCWGLNQVATKVGNSGISPVTQAMLRSLGAALLLIVWARLRGLRLLDRDGTLWLGIVAGLLFGLEFLLIYWGLLFTTASRAVLFVYSAPFVVAIGAHLFIPGERLTPGKLLGLLAAAGGLVLAFADRIALTTPMAIVGDAMCLIAAVAWGATTVLVKATRLRRISAEKTLFYQLAVSALMLAVIAIAVREPGVFALTPIVLLSLIYQFAIVAFASYLAWFWLITRYPASQLASFSFLTPIFGVVAGAVLLDEPIGIELAGAVALIAAGIYLVNRPAT